MAWREPSTAHHHGDWSWQLRGDEIADIGYQDQLLLRSARAVSRDRDWGTRDVRLVGVGQTATGVRMSVAVHDADGTLLLGGTVTVEAVHARLTITTRLRAQVEVWTNRTGLVVLHPPHLAGTALAVTHPGGDVETTAFPRTISPHQPAIDITGLTWTAGQDDVDLRFEGDTFEMEDQRNWTDASFKTYSRPLSLPFPYRVAEGDVVHQQVHVSVRTATPTTWAAAGATASDAASTVCTAPSTGADRGQRNTLRLGGAGAFPEVVLGAATGPDPAPADVEGLTTTVLVELELATAQWRPALARARAAGRPLDVRLVLDHRDQQHLASLAAAAAELAGLDVVRVAAFDTASHVTDEPTAAALRTALRDAALDLPVVGGARSHFTELNREQAGLPAGLDGVAFSITPLFHAVGTEQLIESVAVQRTVAEQAVAIAGGAPVHVGPVTLRPRFNNVATTASVPSSGTVDDGAETGLPDGYGAEQHGQDDPRQGAAQLAAWTIASAAALAVPGVASVAFFEEWGPRGICSADGADLPVAAAVRALTRLLGGQRLVGASPDGLVWAIGSATARSSTVLAANLDDQPRRLVVETPRGTVLTGLEAGAWSTSVLPG